jgi:chromosome segregation ATPase
VVKPSVTETQATARRSIGEILLEHGYVTEEQLAQAVQWQEQTGKPLGQVLVEAGTITRLELASALAEQWSGAEMPAATKSTGGPNATESTPRLVEHEAPPADLDELIERLVEVESLLIAMGRRVDAAVAVDTLEERLGVLAVRLDEAVSRIETTEAGLAAVPSQLEEAVGDTLDPDAVISHVESLGARVDELAARPPVDPALADRVEGLAAQVDGLAQRAEESAPSAAVTELQALVEELTERPDGTGRADELAAALEALRGQVEELAARPQADTALATGLASAEARLETLEGSTAALSEVRALVDEVAARPVGDPETAAATAEALAALAERVDEIAAARAEDAGLPATVADLSATVERLAGQPESMADLDERLAALVATLDGLAEPVTALDGRVTALEGALPDRELLEQLRAAVDELVARPAVPEEVSARLAALDEGAAAAGSGLADTGRMLGELGERLRGVEAALPDAERLEELRRVVDELAERPPVAEELVVRLEALDEAASALATRLAAAEEENGETQAEIARIGEEATAARSALEDAGKLAGRLDALEGREPTAPRELAELADRLAAVEAALPDAERLEELRRVVDELAERPPVAEELVVRLDTIEQGLSDTTALTELAAVVEALSTRFDALGDVSAERVGELATALEALAARVDEIPAADDPAADPALVERVERLEAGAPTVGAAEELEGRLAALEREAVARSAELSLLAEEVATARAALDEGIAAAVAAGASVHSPPVPAANGSGPGEPGMDGLRVAVEGLRMRLAQHEKAVAEIVRSGGAGAAPRAERARPAGDVPADAQELWDEFEALVQRVAEAETSILTQVEKTASQLVWRIQRLEGGGQG